MLVCPHRWKCFVTCKTPYKHNGAGKRVPQLIQHHFAFYCCITNYHKFSGLIQHPFIISLCCESEVGWLTWFSMQNLTRPNSSCWPASFFSGGFWAESACRFLQAVFGAGCQLGLLSAHLPSRVVLSTFKAVRELEVLLTLSVQGSADWIRLTWILSAPQGELTSNLQNPFPAGPTQGFE